MSGAAIPPGLKGLLLRSQQAQPSGATQTLGRMHALGDHHLRSNSFMAGFFPWDRTYCSGAAGLFFRRHHSLAWTRGPQGSSHVGERARIWISQSWAQLRGGIPAPQVQQASAEFTRFFSQGALARSMSYGCLKQLTTIRASHVAVVSVRTLCVRFPQRCEEEHVRVCTCQEVASLVVLWPSCLSSFS